MRLFKYILLIIALIIFAIFVNIWVQKGNNTNIKIWAKGNNKEFVDSELKWSTSDSPFYYKGKNQYIYKITVINKTTREKEIWYMRTNIFGDEYIKNN